MSRITKVVYIKAEPQKVLDYIASVENHPAFISSLKSVDNLTGNPKEAGTTWEWTYLMAGVEVKGKAETVNFEEGKVYSYKTLSGLVSTFTYSVESADEGTKLTIDVVYELPDNVIAKVLDKSVVERLNSEEADRAGETLQAILEN